MEPLNPLAPIFAASVAVQQVLEVFSVAIERRVGEKRKKSVLGIIGFVVGIAVARAFGLDVMSYFELNSNVPGVDTVVTALVLSAGTEGTNSIVKFLKYLKEDKKATAAETLELVRKRAVETTAPVVPSAARRTLEMLRDRAGMTAPSRAGTTSGQGDEAFRTPALNNISSK
jgi:hypothetical protein